MNKLILAAVLPAALLCLAACNTVGGLGKDLQQVGGVIAGTATGVQNASTPGRAVPQDASAPTSPAATDSCQPDLNGLVLAGCPEPQPAPQ